MQYKKDSSGAFLEINLLEKIDLAYEWSVRIT